MYKGLFMNTFCSPNTGLKCKGQAPPAHGKLYCKEDANSQDVYCKMSCDPGYDVEFLAAERYVCHTDGTWTAEPPSVGTQWPNCTIYA